MDTERTTPSTVDADRVERAARALFERDWRRSLGRGTPARIWPRVRDEYRRQATLALNAADQLPDDG